MCAARYVVIDPANPQVILTEVPGIPPPGPHAVAMPCDGCDKRLRIAPATALTKVEMPKVPLLCWGCWCALVGQVSTMDRQWLTMDVDRFRQRNKLSPIDRGGDDCQQSH